MGDGYTADLMPNFLAVAFAPSVRCIEGQMSTALNPNPASRFRLLTSVESGLLFNPH